MKKLKIISLFSGIGGTDIGFRGGFTFLNKYYKKFNTKIVFANDNDSKVANLFDANFDIKINSQDIKRISSSNIPDGDILTGGFPCQSFSISATNPPRLGIKDERGMLFFEMNRIIKEKKPKVFVAENVKGIFSANNGKTFPLILKTFKESGYNVYYHLFNSSEFGVPQKRQRVFIVGFRKDLNVDFKFPNTIIDDSKKFIPIKNVLENNVSEKYFFSEKAVRGMMKVRKSMNKGRAQNINGPSNTVSAHLAKVSLNSTDPVLIDNNRFRRFTPREVARLQSFPENYKLIGNESQQYKGLGNAIPPVLMWHIANNIINSLKHSEFINNNKMESLDLFKL